MDGEVDIQQRMRRVEELVREMESIADPKTRACAVELVSSLMELHGAGLGRMIEVLGQTGTAGNDAIERFTRDPLVASLLLLYGLHPVALETRVHQALDKVRPTLHAHGGDVELLGIDDGIVRLRLQGSCHSCPSSTMTLKNSIEAAIYEFAPDIAELHVDGTTPPPGPGSFVPLEQLVIGTR